MDIHFGHGHAAWTSTCCLSSVHVHVFMLDVHVHTACPSMCCKLFPCCMSMSLLHVMFLLHVHAHAEWIWTSSMDKDMQHGHWHIARAWTWSGMGISPCTNNLFHNIFLWLFKYKYAHTMSCKQYNRSLVKQLQKICLLNHLSVDIHTSFNIIFGSIYNMCLVTNFKIL
jgi:hypothetical protein